MNVSHHHAYGGSWLVKVTYISSGNTGGGHVNCLSQWINIWAQWGVTHFIECKRKKLCSPPIYQAVSTAESAAGSTRCLIVRTLNETYLESDFLWRRTLMFPLPQWRRSNHSNSFWALLFAQRTPLASFSMIDWTIRFSSSWIVHDEQLNLPCENRRGLLLL